MKPVPESEAEEMCHTAVFNFGTNCKVESHHFWFVKHRESMHGRSGKMLTPTGRNVYVEYENREAI